MARTLEFDPDQALSRGMDYFWLHGYEGTHMRDLADYMGISKSSFYNTYGDKHQVYINALNAYLEQEYSSLVELLAGEPSLDQLLPALFFEAGDSFASRERQRGSFLVNAVVERAHHDLEARRVIANHFERFADLLAQEFQSRQLSGEIPRKHDPLMLAHALISSLYSIGVLARLNLGVKARQHVVQSILTLFK